MTLTLHLVLEKTVTDYIGLITNPMLKFQHFAVIFLPFFKKPTHLPLAKDIKPKTKTGKYVKVERNETNQLRRRCQSLWPEPSSAFWKNKLRPKWRLKALYMKVGTASRTCFFFVPLYFSLSVISFQRLKRGAFCFWECTVVLKKTVDWCAHQASCP